MFHVVSRCFSPSLRRTDYFKNRWLAKRFAGKSSVPQAPLQPLSSVISVDCRESSLMSALSLGRVPHTSVRLTEGDVVIEKRSTNSENPRRIVIERKSVMDFYNSIKNRRLADQISRMFEVHSKDSIVVILLEGSLLSQTDHIWQTVVSAYTSLVMRDRVAVIRTDSVEQSAKLICSMSRFIDKFFASPNSFSEIVHVERGGRKLSGVHLPYLRLLTSVNGISVNRARAIERAYPSVESLVSSIRASNGVSHIAHLVASSSNKATGSPIGIAAATNLAESLLGPHDPIVGEAKLVKYLLTSECVKSDALCVAKKYKSVAALRLAFLKCGISENTTEIPPSVTALLSSYMTDPSILFNGLKQVAGISAKTAEHIAKEFKCMQFFHKALTQNNDPITLLRLSGGGKRMIAKTAAENIIAWLKLEGCM